ncbi:glutathione S-transferase family protein [Devosia chinhatensis]|uniref:Glutathione S-transferase n=1 Tax=Devosia chinhatensis TaxID=429727 RepID=A0A0F5FHA9_9HYPH|nr:glutathione S-transferase family protein [Devosia chinhatensis]KKB08236.1 glutathione S-transferase [Devosia chinhatensis]
MRVLGRVTSINVRKVLWALDEMGAVYDREDWGLPLRDPKVPEFLALNPNGQVPVLVDGDFALWESNAILVYLADKAAPGQLLPTDLQQKGRVLQWLGWQAAELNPAWGYAVMALQRKTPGYDDPQAIAASLERWTARLDILEAELGRNGPFLGGSVFSIADIAIGLSTHRWMCLPADRKSLPAVEAHYQRLLERPAGARWMSPATP